MSNTKREKNRTGIMSYISRLILVAVVLAITSFLTPGFSIIGLWSILSASAIIIVLDYLVERMMGVDTSPFGRGIKGFAISALILYAAQFLVPNMNVSLIGAVLASLVIGILDAILPGKTI